MINAYWLFALIPGSVLVGVCIMALLVAAADDAFKGGM